MKKTIEKLERLISYYNRMGQDASDQLEEGSDDESLESVSSWFFGAAYALSNAILLLEGDDSPLRAIEDEN